ncbi:MAG: type IV pilin N-terminal domain-containing protein [Methanomicrobiaceae archaeon]|nr:type IV pilin N-terminal domain-containing protein [Methanomicrobiaceae archaeon]
MSTFNSEDAASESIGTVLAVAITVILAGIAMVMFFGMAHEVQDTYVVSTSVKFVDNDIVITYHGGTDQDKLERLDWSVYNSTGAKFNDTSVDTWLDHPEIGDTTGTTSGPFTPDTYRVVVVGTFADGAKQVVLDKTITH